MALIKSVLPDTITVLGWCYPTVMPEKSLLDKNIDYIFIGHAEERITDFLNLFFKKDKHALSEVPGIGFYDSEVGNNIINSVKTYISDVNEMVKPDYSLIDIKSYLSEEVKLGETYSKNPVPPGSDFYLFGV